MSLFQRLFSRGKKEAFDPPPEFLEEPGPDWVVALTGQELPHGDRFSIRVSLAASTREGTAEVVILPSAPSKQPATVKTELARTELDRLFVILGFSFPQDVVNVPSGALDGLPVNLSIYRKEPPTLQTAECNLVEWLGSKKPGPPAVEIGRVLLEIKQRMKPR